MKTRTHLNRKSNDGAIPTTASQLQPRAFEPTPQAEAQLQSPAESSGFDLSNVSVLPNAAPPIQAKLTIGEPNDKYEQEADQVAAQVVNQINSPQPAAAQAGTVQREAMPEEEELQMKPDLQREAMPEEEELQMKPDLQREAMPEEEEELQMKPAAEASAATPKKS